MSNVTSSTTTNMTTVAPFPFQNPLQQNQLLIINTAILQIQLQHQPDAIETINRAIENNVFLTDKRLLVLVRFMRGLCYASCGEVSCSQLLQDREGRGLNSISSNSTDHVNSKSGQNQQFQASHLLRHQEDIASLDFNFVNRAMANGLSFFQSHDGIGSMAQISLEGAPADSFADLDSNGQILALHYQ
jgi:hypothetical protein